MFAFRSLHSRRRRTYNHRLIASHHATRDGGIGAMAHNGSAYVTSPEADRAEGLCGGAARPSAAEPEPTEGRRCTYALLSAVARVNQCQIPSHHIEATNPFHYLEDQEASDSLYVDTHEQEYPSAMKDAVDN